MLKFLKVGLGQNLFFQEELKVYTIKAVNNIAAIKPLIAHLKNAVFAVDLDSTTIIPKQIFGSCRWFQAYLQKQQQNKNTEIALKDAITMFNYAQCHTETQPVEGKATQDFLSELHKNHKVVYVTARGKIIANSTERQLRASNILFNYSPEFINKNIDLSKYASNCHARNGIIYAHGGHKGECLIKYLQEVGTSQIENIVAIDDKQEHLHEYARAANSTGKKFLGFYYRAVDHTITEEDLEIAELQYTTHRAVSGTGKLMSDDEARDVLKLRKIRAN
jgi:hypothetical protein